MCCRQCRADLLEDPAGALGLKRLWAIEEVSKAPAPKEPRHHVGSTGLAPVVVDGRDMLVLQHGDGLSLGIEPPDERRIVRPVLVHDPDRDFTADVRLRRPVDDAGWVLAEALEQPVAAQRLSTRVQLGTLGEDAFLQPAQFG